MPIPCPHFKITIVKRSQGQSAVAGAAYQSGERLFSEYDQRTKFYNKKKELVHAEIMLPSHAPPGYADRATLWNAVEAVENQWNSQLARRIVLAFPVEVPKEQYLKMIREFCQEQFVSKGHDRRFCHPRQGRWKPTRPHPADASGRWTNTAGGFQKPERFTTLTRTASASSSPPATGSVTRRTPWTGTTRSTPRFGGTAGKPSPTAIWKPLADRNVLTSAHSSVRAVQQIPTVHLGHAAHQMEKRGVETFLGNLNRDIRAANSLMQSIRSAIRGLQRWIADLN